MVAAAAVSAVILKAHSHKAAVDMGGGGIKGQCGIEIRLPFRTVNFPDPSNLFPLAPAGPR